MNETIIAAAILYKNFIFSLPPPARHHTVLHWMHKMSFILPTHQKGKQGFLTNTGRFVDRQEGLEIAKNSGQIIRRCGGDNIALYSENLW